MDSIADIMPPRDADGVMHIGRPARGCRHCGKTEVHYSADGRVAWHHPGVTCCPKAVQDQIDHRRGDLARLRHAAQESADAVEDLRKRADAGFGKEASEVKGLVPKAQRAHEVRLGRLRVERDAVMGELGEAERQLAGFGQGTLVRDRVH